MEAALVIWLVSLLDSIKMSLAVLATLSLIVMFFLYLAQEDHNRECRKEEDKVYWPWKRYFCTIAFTFLCSAVIPSTQTGYIMMGAYFGQSLIQSKEAEKTYNLIIKKLEKGLEEK